MNYNPDPRRFDPFNPQTGYLATTAAVFLDNASRGNIEESDYKSIDMLASYLKKATKNTSPHVVSVLNEIFQSFSHRPLEKVDDLIYRASLMAHEMSDARNLSRSRLEVLRNVCVKISQVSLAYSIAARQFLAA
ncbi:hypothetical protein KW787_04065 [Candidatus Pacearchaeota archaeon]|nr:hypothetical protein [Candidatus Pacearchaeota archaeon]